MKKIYGSWWNRQKQYLLKYFSVSNPRLIPKYAKKIRECDKKYQKKKRREHPGYKCKEYRNYRKRFPDKVKAQQLLNTAIKKGKITRSPCARCGATQRIHGHHDDYAKPLKVLWLCSIHHAERHKKLEIK